MGSSAAPQRHSDTSHMTNQEGAPLMSADPHSRALRGALSGAVRNGDQDLEAELRHELMLRNIETAVAKLLGDVRLTGVEVYRLKMVVEGFGPRAAKAAPVDPPGDEDVA